MKMLLFIYNRFAGKDRNWVGLSDIVQTLTAEGFLVTTYPTQAPGDAAGAMTRWGANYDRVVVAGGDGTLNEAISGLLLLEDRPILGYIPIGTTNDFGRTLSLPQNLIDAALVAAGGSPKSCDVGYFNGRPFVYVAAFGAFVDVPFSTPQPSKNLLGYAAYLLESVKHLGTMSPRQVTLEHDWGTFSGKYLYGMVSNSTSVAGIKGFPPGDPHLDDGLLEVTLIPPPKDILELERLARGLLLGQLDVVAPMIITFSTPRVKITCDEEMIWTLDGENGGQHAVADIFVEHRAFTIVHGE